MHINGFSIFLIKVQVNTLMDIAIESYGNRKVGLICRDSFGGRLITTIAWKCWPDGNNQPNAQNCADSAGNNGKWHTKKLCHGACFYFAELRSTHEEDLIDTGHPPA